MINEYIITPVSKPRMTQSDRWKKRKCTMDYWLFKDQCRLLKVNIRNGDHIVFVMPVPKSTSAKKAKGMMGMPHLVTPDIDNLMKALLDAIFKSDSLIWDIHATKIWGAVGSIIVKRKNREEE